MCMGVPRRHRRRRESRVTTDVQTRMRELEQQNRDLKRANEILKRAASSFGAESGRQHTNERPLSTAPKMTLLLTVISGVERICRVVQATPSTYDAANGRPASARHVQDVEVAPQLHTIWESNYSAYGVCREKRVTTPKPDQTATRHPDLVNRVFGSDAPNPFWVTDVTFVPTWQDVAYVCFIIDVFDRAIIGWRCASNMKTETVLDAIKMARWSRGSQLPELRCHSDAGSQFTSIRYGERLTEIGATPSIGTVGDSYDNALTETVNRYDKAELIRGPTKSGPCKTVDKLELATLGRVHWHTTRRLHSYLGDAPPSRVREVVLRRDNGITSTKKLVQIT